MKVIYTAHLEFRLKIREILHDLPRKIFKESREHYYDTHTDHRVALSTVMFKNKSREMALTYDKIQNEIQLITVHPVKPYQKHSRLKSGRWRKI